MNSYHRINAHCLLGTGTIDMQVISDSRNAMTSCFSHVAVHTSISHSDRRYCTIPYDTTRYPEYDCNLVFFQGIAPFSPSSSTSIITSTLSRFPFRSLFIFLLFDIFFDISSLGPHLYPHTLSFVYLLHSQPDREFIPKDAV